MRKITSILVVLVALVGLMPQVVASAAESGTTSGSFTIGNVAPGVTAIHVHSDAALTLITSTLTPQVTYYVQVTVSDSNTLDDISQIKLKMFYDATGPDPLEDTITAGNTQTAAIITWTKAGDAWAIDGGAGTSWAVVTGSCVKPAMTASGGDWVIAFKVGKVATESLGAANWDFHARATDSTSLTAGMYSRNATVLWYGQITMNTANVNWGSVDPGTGFGAAVNKQTGISATFITNGDFNELVKSASTWAGASNTAIYDSTGATANPKEFSLKAWNSDTYGSAILVDTTGVITENDEGLTTETGDVSATNTLWLKLATVFPIDVYTGTITYIIANR